MWRDLGVTLPTPVRFAVAAIFYFSSQESLYYSLSFLSVLSGRYPVDSSQLIPSPHSGHVGAFVHPPTHLQEKKKAL